MKQISMTDNIDNIPDDKFFAVKGKHIKVFLKMLKLANTTDRNEALGYLQLKYNFDLFAIYKDIRNVDEVTIVDKSKEAKEVEA